MQMSDILSICAITISLFSAVFNFIYIRKQTKIQQKQLDEQIKHKFTDDPLNPYTMKLGNISDNLIAIAQQIHHLNKK